MVNDYLKKFEFNYESSATGSFLVVSADAGENVLLYQVEMLANNPNKNILPLDIRQKDSKLNFYYNITSKLALSQYLKRNKLKRDDFINIFRDITKTILSSKDYLLSDKSYILNEDYIYINPNTMEVSMVYLPLNIEHNVNEQLKNFAINFIMFSANINETNSDNFLQRILNLLKSDTFNILEFNKLLNDLKSESDIPKPAVQKAAVQEQNVPVQAESMAPQPKPSAPRQNIPKSPVPKPDVPKSEIPKPGVPKAAPQAPVSARPAKPVHTVNTAEKTVVKMKYKTSVLIIGAILQLVLVVGSIALLASGAMDSLGNEPVVNILGIGILAGAITYAIWKTVLNEKNKVEVVSKVAEKPAPRPQINMEKRNFTTVPNIQSTNQSSKTSSQPEFSFNNTSGTANPLNETTVIFPPSIEETVYLGTSNSYPYLQGTANGVTEQIIINKPSFIIGRLKSQVDYISQNNAVGKVHAEIISRNGLYFVKDLNSRNGTFVNGVRLAANTEYEIKNNDKITFANSEYVFIIP
ncbi:MAG TPA: DUF6382 domain-containing protein [Acetivibrio sp.]|uniref:DUF6382 domain-containing protein n=1 Tax=Acetivibrio sp. TaxID=1872092 RepID=UPI002D089AFE|nr:DUF6382 domain-containing protein [Acetivibrio sp.]HOM03326.1 DUF6382 domain-containing protein [Acetivibrio sp.]